MSEQVLSAGSGRQALLQRWARRFVEELSPGEPPTTERLEHAARLLEEAIGEASVEHDRPALEIGATLEMRASDQEQGLREHEPDTHSQAQLLHFIDALPFLVSFVTADERYGLVNRAYEGWFGEPREALLGRTLLDVIGEAAYAQLRPFIQRGLAGEEFSFEQHAVPYRLGGERDVRVTFVPTRTRRGSVEGYVAVLEDITAQRRLEAERETLARQRTEVLESMGDAFFAVDKDWRFILVNQKYEQLSHLGRDDILGHLFWDAFTSGDDPTSWYFQSFHRTMEERVPLHFVDDYSSAGLWTDVRVYPTANGGIAAFFRDVSIESQAEAALKRQAEFEQQLIGIVSHDLRTPLNAILLGAGALMGLDGLDAVSLKIATRIRSSADRASRMIRDLLDFTQARLGGGIPVRPGSVDMHALVRQVVEEVEASTPGREVTLHQEGDGRIDGDSDRLAQVVVNLLTNALKYSPAGTPVRVTVRATDPELTLTIQNQGPPIPEEKLATVFEPMQRASADIDRLGRSVGLGLYIVRHIVEAHRGRIEVTSTAAEGTTFTIHLPHRERSGPAAAAHFGPN